MVLIISKASVLGAFQIVSNSIRRATLGEWCRILCILWLRKWWDREVSHLHKVTLLVRSVEIQTQTLRARLQAVNHYTRRKQSMEMSCFQTSPMSWFSVSRANTNFVSVYSRLKCFFFPPKYFIKSITTPSKRRVLWSCSGILLTFFPFLGKVRWAEFLTRGSLMARGPLLIIHCLHPLLEIFHEFFHQHAMPDLCFESHTRFNNTHRCHT